MEREDKLIVALLIIIVILSAVALIVTQTGLTFNKNGGDNLTMNTTNMTLNRTVDDGSNDSNYNYDTGISNPNPDSTSYSGYSYNSYSYSGSGSQSYSNQGSQDVTPDNPTPGSDEGGSDTPSEPVSSE